MSVNVEFSTPRPSRRSHGFRSYGTPEYDNFNSETQRLLGENSSISARLPRNDFLAISDSTDGSSDSGPGHCHSDQARKGTNHQARRKLIIASILCLLFMLGEIVGGIMASSLAIVSDAAHLMSDFGSFMISLLALYLASRPATKKLSFGWYRAEILGALVSVLIIWLVTGILVYLAVMRIINTDYEIEATIMLITAACGVGVNILMGLTLHQHGHGHGGHGHSHGGHGHSHQDNHNKPGDVEENTQQYGTISTQNNVHAGDGTVDKIEPKISERKSSQNINVRAAFIHVIGDLVQSIGILIASIIIYFKPEWKIADPICTFLFSVLVLITTITILRDILRVLMEATPRGINFSEVRNSFYDIDGVQEVHNLRLWSLTMDKAAMSVHLAIKCDANPLIVLKQASLVVMKKFGIDETTIQIEEYVDTMQDCLDCQCPKD